MKNWKQTTLLLSLILGLGTARAKDKNPTLLASSGKSHVQLIELFSSEGCSSCPPADKWIAGLKDQPDLWKKFVPIALHVDYWDHLGWKDGFASPAITQRQIEISHQWTNPVVYTPAVVVDGQEFRAWAKSEKFSAAPQTPSDLILSLFREANGNYSVKVEGQKKGKTYKVHLAELGMNASSEVKAGENSGQTLRHNFVVLSWQIQDLGSKSKLDFSVKKEDRKVSQLALAVWIEEAGIPKSLQATGAYL